MDDNSGPSAPPPPRKPLDFHNGEPTKSKKEFVKACRILARSRVGLRVSSWDEVDDVIRYDMFRILQRDFELEETDLSYVMKLMCNQLKSWRCEIRKKYINKDMSVAEIRQLRSKNPLKGVPLQDWENFIEREANESKLDERETARENRAHYSDPHRLGTRSYNELQSQMSSDGIEMDRGERYTYARTDKETGLVHPYFAATAKKLAVEKTSLDPIDRAQVEKDALARVLGPDSHGRVRGVSSKMSKMQYKSFFSSGCKKAKALKDDFIDTIRTETGPTFKELFNRMAAVEGKRPTSSSSSATPSIPLSSPSPSDFRRQVRTQQTPTPSSDSRALYTLFSPVTYEHVAYGSGPVVPLSGEIVHGVTCNPSERRIVISNAAEGKEMSLLYKPVGDVDTIFRAIGYSVIWPTALCHRISE